MPRPHPDTAALGGTMAQGIVSLPQSMLLDPLEAADRRLAADARAALGAWLGQYDWDHFSTLTFAEPPSEHAAVRGFGRWIRRLEQRTQHAVHWVYTIERCASSARHIHALLHGTGCLSVSSVRAAWGHGYTRVLVYDRRRGAARYVAKFVAWGDPEWDIRPPLLHFDSSTHA